MARQHKRRRTLGKQQTQHTYNVPRHTVSKHVLSNRARLPRRDERLPFIPPEDWHEPDDGDGYRIVHQPPGKGYRHVVTPAEVRDRLADLPPQFVAPLEVVQLSRMTRKKQSFPCYGMQWGAALYLYPLETELVEHYHRPPRPEQVIEARMYGGRWQEPGDGTWRLIWTERTIKDFYLNNILIHELGHLLDERNSSYTDRERWAEWFAVEFGYKSNHPLRSRPKKQKTRRRHHSA
ncbi:MAG: hypothetical protein R3C10_17405 [Pirellulales bacterium]|nr:hypothetical protein [Planctomycetales bacterium]